MVESAQIADLDFSNRATLGYRAWALVALNFFFKGEKDVTLVVGEPVRGSKRRAIATNSRTDEIRVHGPSFCKGKT